MWTRDSLWLWLSDNWNWTVLCPHLCWIYSYVTTTILWLSFLFSAIVQPKSLQLLSQGYGLVLFTASCYVLCMIVPLYSMSHMAHTSQRILSSITQMIHELIGQISWNYVFLFHWLWMNWSRHNYAFPMTDQSLWHATFWLRCIARFKAGTKNNPEISIKSSSTFCEMVPWWQQLRYDDCISS